jgi:hypothetical protein
VYVCLSGAIISSKKGVLTFESIAVYAGSGSNWNISKGKDVLSKDMRSKGSGNLIGRR